MNFKSSIYVLGNLLVIVGIAELFPAFLELMYSSAEAENFFLNSLFCLFLGMMLILANKSFKRNVSIRDMFMITSLSWVSVSFFAALPLYTSNLGLSFTDAFFEATSGITTTGSTVLSRLDSMSYGILLWRSIIQWIGGIGLVAFAIILLPSLRVGGMQLFQTESSDKSDKIIPRNADIMRYLVIIYCALTVGCFFAFYIGGMTFFDALNHAMTTIPTGGYSTHDLSFGYFQSDFLHLSATLFMFLGGLPFMLYVNYLSRGRFDFFKNEQFIIFSLLCAALTFILTLWLWTNSDYSIWRSFVLTSFNIISVITTTGFATTDYTLWGSFAIMFFFFLTYVGSCAGSTSGGLKIMRISIIAKSVFRQINSMIYPNGVFLIHYQNRPVEQRLVISVLVFCGLYVLSNVVLTFALTLLGLDFTTAISGAATAIANVGPGVGDIIGPAGNFATLPDTAKWLLCIGMILGRLEILTAMVLFTPNFWRV